MKEVLVKARELISDPLRWTQGAYARKSTSEATHANDSAAICFCAAGALQRASEGDWYAAEDAKIFVDSFLAQGLIHFNDTHTHAEILALFDKAIASCQ